MRSRRHLVCQRYSPLPVALLWLSSPLGQSNWIIYRQAILTNVLNPKVALFFLAFLPQFINPGSGTKVMAFLILGLTFIFNGTIWCMLVAWFASAFGQRLRGRPATESWLNRAAGALFVGLGLKMVAQKT
jgi:threonine/homoserine/homoserine lactone efflux protein